MGLGAGLYGKSVLYLLGLILGVFKSVSKIVSIACLCTANPFQEGYTIQDHHGHFFAGVLPALQSGIKFAVTFDISNRSVPNKSKVPVNTEQNCDA